MNNETNRLAQIIGHAADKYRGLAGLRLTEQDKAAAQAIEAEYLFIRRDQLPKTAIVDRDGVPHVDVGSDAGTWSCKTSSADYARQTGLEYLAAAEAIQEWHEREAERQRRKRKIDLWEQFGGLPGEEDERLEKAIDQIIALEAAREVGC